LCGGNTGPEGGRGGAGEAGETAAPRRFSCRLRSARQVADRPPA